MRSTAARSVRSSSTRVSPRTCLPRAQRGAVRTRYPPTNPAAPVIKTRGFIAAAVVRPYRVPPSERRGKRDPVHRRSRSHNRQAACRLKLKMGKQLRVKSAQLEKKRDQPAPEIASVVCYEDAPCSRSDRHRRPLAAGQLAIAYAMRLVGFSAETLLAIRLVVAIVAFKPYDFAVAFKGENVCGDPIEKPPVMATDHRTAGKV